MTDLGRVLIAAAERNPHALAVVDGERRFDYGAWLGTVSRVAGGIGTLGLRPGDRLAVIMQNRWEMAALHWACQLAGVVAVPLNWRSNADELDYFLTDSGAAALAFDGSAAAAVADSAAAARLRRIGAGGASEGTVAFETCWRRRPKPHPVPAKTTSRSCSTPRAPPGAARACPAATAPSVRLRWPTSRRTATAPASAPSASCRSTTPWACARCSPWRRWAAPSSANRASRRKARSA